MKHRDLQRLAQRLLDEETIGGANVFEVDASHGRLEKLAEANDILRVLRADFEIEDVDVGELLEEVAFPLHDGLAGNGADVPEAEHRRAVGDDGNKISLGGVRVRFFRVSFDFETGLGNTRRIGKRQVPLIRQRLGWDDRDLAGASFSMVFESLVPTGHLG